MNAELIQKTFRSAVHDSITLLSEGTDRFQIFAPFQFDDGDHFVMTLRKESDGNWIISDEGHTFMHLSYDMDVSLLRHGTRNEIVSGALQKYGIEEWEGRIFVRLDDLANAGDILFKFIQCLISIVNVTCLKRERAGSTFAKDFKQFIRENVDSNRVKFNYFDESFDPGKFYPVDCRINGLLKPIHIYAINNNNKCQNATISILNFQNRDIPFVALGIFEDQKKISRKSQFMLTDVCDHQFSSLAEDKNEIVQYLEQQIG